LAASVRVIGAKELAIDFETMRRLIEEDPELITGQLADSMRKFVHVKSGHLKSTIYHKGLVAGADAGYAGYEADRGGEHDFAEQAIEDFDIEKYADKVVEPF
jgi:hypothetical protein